MTNVPRAVVRGVVRGVVRAAGVVCAAGCTTLADPGTPFALEFSKLPWPAVVAGDTLRDSTGLTAAPRAIVLDAAGDTLRTASVSFVVLDTGVRLVTGNRLVPVQWRDTPVRVVAEAGSVQSRPVLLLITRRPDTLVAAAATVAPLRYTPILSPSSNVSAAIQVRLRSRQVVVGSGADSAVRGWPVDFSIVRPPSAALVDSVVLVNEASATGMTRDTTDATGVAGIRVRVFPKAGQTAADSVVLQAVARHRGVVVPGSPVRLVVRLERETP